MATERARTPYDVTSLVALAADVFTRRGYDGTSISELAREAGLTKSSIYHHVEGKEHLLRLALQRALDPLFAVLDEPGAREGRALDRLEHVLRRQVEVLVRELPYVTLLLRVRGNTDTERWALQRRREFDAAVAGLAREAAADGDLRADLDAALVARLVAGMTNSVVEWYRPVGQRAERGTRPGAQHLADTVVHLALDGWRAR